MVAYKSGTSFNDRNFSCCYYYDSKKRLRRENLDLGAPIYADTYYTYDSFDRVTNIELNYEGTFILDTDYTFSETGTQTSSQVKTYTSTVNGTATTYSYTYDSRGYITAISVGGTQKYRYVYDNLGQLVREDNVPKNQTYVYTYDNSGNITSKKTYSLTAQGLTPIGTYTTKSYSYSTGTWGDLLTSFNGGSITYDGIGNPTKYYDGKTFTWEGRRLVGAVNGSTTMSFMYNDEGMRTSKTVAGVTTNYYYNGSQLISEETNGKVKLYLYNSTGVIGFRYRTSSYGTYTWDTFFYEKNLQGDITAVYSSTGVKKISYTYDAWGNTVTTYYNGASATNLANPFTYRGYYYDTDLGLYYLNSRYYDSNTGRFISPDLPDVVTATPYALTDKNLYAYCDNNPVMRIDGDGEFWNIIVGAAIGFLGGIIDQAINGDWSSNGWSQTAVSTIEGAATALVGPLAGGLISGISGAVNSAIDGNDTEQILTDALVSTGISFLSSTAQLTVGRALAGKFVNNASKTQLKTFANSLGYVGRNFKSSSSWTGTIMLDASKKFMNESSARIVEKAVSFSGARLYNGLVK